MIDPDRGGVAAEVADRLDGRSPVLGALAVGVAGYLALGLVLLGLGRLITGVLLDGPFGRWDMDGVTWFTDRRGEPWDTLTAVGSGLADTAVIIGIGSVVASILLVKRWAQGTVLIAVAVFTEVAVFLSVALLVPRNRPDVAKLDAVPPTSSFPSGHTAASIALYGSLVVLAGIALRPGAVRWLAMGAIGLVPVAVSLSRIYRGMHHPSDVLAGVLLGLGAVAVGVLAARTALALARARSGLAPAPARADVARERP